MKTSLKAVDSEEVGEITDEGYLVSNEQLARIGDGDIKKGRRWLRMMMADEREPKRHVGPTPLPKSIRIADEKDERAVFDLIMRDLFENAASIASIDPIRVMDYIRAGTQRRGGIVAVIDDADGNPVAVTVIVPVQWAFSQAFHAQEVFNYVHPDHRASRHAEDLIKFGNWCADEWSRNFGYRVYIVSSVLTHGKVREKLRFYRRFITQLGAMFLYPAPPEA